ncbi:hypothetical protein NDU88_004743 [Pleurodeles waltl]|uniref:Uncharacterized protein n=1 Tax=Pleurodeles waltl TaxID=8319 RepID=A0AAV7KZ93_PLEWA|nr:hypothetical protein NDU88_004743 [Pleurodeles waltl]
MEGGPGHPNVLINLCAERGEGRDPILGLRPCRAQKAARGGRKGPRRVPRPLTRATVSPAARPQAAAVSSGCATAAGARGTTTVATDCDPATEV